MTFIPMNVRFSVAASMTTREIEPSMAQEWMVHLKIKQNLPSPAIKRINGEFQIWCPKNALMIDRDRRHDTNIYKQRMATHVEFLCQCGIYVYVCAFEHTQHSSLDTKKIIPKWSHSSWTHRCNFLKVTGWACSDADMGSHRSQVAPGRHWHHVWSFWWNGTFWWNFWCSNIWWNFWKMLVNLSFEDIFW